MQDSQNLNTNQNSDPMSNVQLDSMAAPQDAGSDNKKKIFIFIGVLLLVTAAIITAYYLTRPSTPGNVAAVDGSVKLPDLSGNNQNEYYTDGNNSTTSTGILPDEPEYSPLRQLWKDPVAAYASRQSSGEDGAKVNNFYFVDKTSGSVYMTNDADSKYEISRMGIALVSDISKAVFDKDITNVYYLKSGALYRAAVPTITDSELELGEAIEIKVKDIYNSPSDNSIIYTKLENGGLTIYRYDPVKNTPSKLTSLPLSNLSVQVSTKSELLLYTGATEKSPQDVMIYNIVSGVLQSYLKSEGSSLVSGADAVISKRGELYYKNQNDGSIKSLEVFTFADKCIFVELKKVICAVPNRMISNQIDEWYMGNTTFTDSLYYIDLNSGSTSNFFDQSLVSGVSIDTTGLYFKDKALMFQNKNDKSLWLMDVSGLLSDV